MRAVLRRLVTDETGATSIEYALIGALVSVAIIVGATALGVKVNAMYDAVQAKITPPS